MKQPPSPSIATRNPPMAGPTILAPLMKVEFKAIAFIRSFLGTNPATRTCRAG